MKKLLIMILVGGLLGTADEPLKYSLDKCIGYALEHSPGLDNQKIAADLRKLEVAIQEARFDFKLMAGDSHYAQEGENNLNVTLAKELENGLDLSAWVDSSHRNGEGVNGNTLALRVSKTILGGGSRLETRYDLEAAMLDSLMALNTYARTRRKLVQDIKVAYYNVISAQQSLLVKQRALENARRTLAMTREREKPLDIITAEIRIPDNELAVNTATRAIQSGLESLKKLMGMPISEPFDITGEFDFGIHEFDLKADLEWARENLETFVNNRLTRKKLDMQVRIKDEHTLPTVSLAATHYQYGSGRHFDTKGKDEQLFSVNLTWELGRRADLARLGIARCNLAVNQNDYFALDQELATSLTDYHRRLREAAQGVVLREQLCQLQQRKQELYADRWENGEIDILELVRAQTDLEDAAVSLINQKITYLELLAYYEYTMGK